MNSEVEVANAALGEIGVGPINAFRPSEDNEPSRQVAINFDRTRDELLRKYAWNFSTTRQQLAAEATAPLMEFSTQYQLPTDPYCLRTLGIYNSSGIRFDIDWRVEGRKLLCNESVIFLRYLGRVTAVVLWDSLFTEAFIFRLATKISLPLTRNMNTKKAMQEQYELIIQEARTSDSLEGSMDEITSDELTNVRIQ